MLLHRLIDIAKIFTDLLRYLFACYEIFDEFFPWDKGLIILRLDQLFKDFVLNFFKLS